MATNWGATKKPNYKTKQTKRMAGDKLMGRAGKRMHRDSAEHMDKKDAGAQKQLDKYSKITEGGGELSERQQKKKAKYEKGMERRETRREAQSTYKKGDIGSYDFAARGKEGIDRRDIQHLVNEGYSMKDIQAHVASAQKGGAETGKKAQALLQSYMKKDEGSSGGGGGETASPAPTPTPTATPAPTPTATPGTTPGPSPTPTPAPAPAPTPTSTTQTNEQNIDQTKKFSGNNKNTVGGNNYGNMGNQDFSVNIQHNNQTAGGTTTSSGVADTTGKGMSNMASAAMYGGLNEQQYQKSQAIFNPIGRAAQAGEAAEEATNSKAREAGLRQGVVDTIGYLQDSSNSRLTGLFGDIWNMEAPEWKSWKEPSSTKAEHDDD